jgi:hypothetical protein
VLRDSGGVLVADNYDFANPGKNDLIVKGSVGVGEGVTMDGALTATSATIRNQFSATNQASVVLNADVNGANVFIVSPRQLPGAGGIVQLSSVPGTPFLASYMVEGEMLISEGNLDGGFAELRAAVKDEDALRYDERPGWLIPVRHSLGASLMQASRFAEAEQVYRDDLARRPENGWSLFGLAQSLHRQDKEEEAKATDDRFRKMWSKADVQITSSCLCQPGL